jgi:hypothetical protein
VDSLNSYCDVLSGVRYELKLCSAIFTVLAPSVQKLFLSSECLVAGAAFTVRMSDGKCVRTRGLLSSCFLQATPLFLQVSRGTSETFCVEVEGRRPELVKAGTVSRPLLGYTIPAH